MTWAVLLAAAYLLGSVPFSVVVVRLLQGIDVRAVGSGNPGATNALRSAGPAAGLAVLALDVGKGALPVLAGLRMGASPGVLAAAAAAAVAGHVFPVYLAFHGGKGVATAVGSLAVLLPVATVSGVLLFLAVVLRTRYVSLASLVLVWSIPPLALLFARAGWAAAAGQALLGAVAIALLVSVRHRGNIGRLLAGTERRLGGSDSRA